MYQHETKGWLKHFDFIMLDSVLIQISFILAYMTRHGFFNLYRNNIYLSCAIVLFMMGIGYSIISETHKNILRRGMFQEFKSSLYLTVIETAAMVLYLFAVQKSEVVSRLTFFYFFVYCVVLVTIFRQLRKKQLLTQNKSINRIRKVLIITSINYSEQLIKTINSHSFGNFEIIGVVNSDIEQSLKKEVDGIPVVASLSNVVEYVQKIWVDEVFVYLPREVQLSQKIMDQFFQMGITIHRVIDTRGIISSGETTIEDVAGCTCITQSMRILTTKQSVQKRCIDIAVGLIGSFITLLLVLILGPAIYLTDPGPIFYSQERVGKNGRIIRIYKFRSMYKDADARKQDLIRKLHLEDQMMFKMKNDPRILGSGPDGTKKGIGWFIRKTSLDEFPQFFNVVKGDLSIVGTRPPTLDEWERYEIHHRARLSVKPGITGMWQVSGRSNITDFDEVVRLDLEYINNWNIGKDIKIIFKTVMVIFT